MNHIILMGRLTKDVEVRVTNGGVNGRSYAVFTLAIDRGKDREGNDLGADFPRCIAWGRTAENMERYTAKGCRDSYNAILEYLDTFTGGDCDEI